MLPMMPWLRNPQLRPPTRDPVDIGNVFLSGLDRWSSWQNIDLCRRIERAGIAARPSRPDRAVVS